MRDYLYCDCQNSSSGNKRIKGCNKSYGKQILQRRVCFRRVQGSFRLRKTWGIMPKQGILKIGNTLLNAV